MWHVACMMCVRHCLSLMLSIFGRISAEFCAVTISTAGNATAERQNAAADWLNGSAERGVAARCSQDASILSDCARLNPRKLGRAFGVRGRCHLAPPRKC
eukprot:COSAG01_NODE_96_length_26789_cov_36.697089_39_plen_100_part_00